MAIDPKKHEMPTQDPKVRAHNFKEVALGYTAEIAIEEAKNINQNIIQGNITNLIGIGTKAEDFEHWIEQASHLDAVPELKSFVDGLKHDIFAIKNAIMFDYNNGLAEGSVTKIKLIKRIMYGRNSFALLKAKVLMHELLYANSN